MTDKHVIWVGSARADLSGLPSDARRQLGFELRRVQQGREARSWKPMPSIGSSVIEIRVRGDDGAFRLFYVAKFSEAIYVLHVFQKKSRKTSGLDLELARSRYSAVCRQRNEE